jgi:hypothetical protein
MSRSHSESFAGTSRRIAELRLRRFAGCWLAGLFALAPLDGSGAETAAGIAPDQLDFFETRIRPALVEHCYPCHSAAAAASGALRGGLVVDTRAGLLAGGESGPAIVAGKPDESLLIAALRYETFEMPPTGKLPESVTDDFVTWIAMGAPDPREGSSVAPGRQLDIEAGKQFWSFQPLQRPEPPEVRGATEPLSPIDRFHRAKLAERGIEAAPSAKPRALVRRLWFDLLGVPPTPEELRAWTSRLTGDPVSGASVDRVVWRELVETLLDRPEYGERWARHWMDVARFAESHGYEQDYDRPTAYHYRDFLIRAFNADLPYDQFVQWQIAGDELAPDEPLAWMATGFLGAGAFPTQLTEAEFESARYDELDDMTATSGVAFLGLSLGCARCHDHKFDPIGVEDYYRFAAAFTSTIRAEKEFPADVGGGAARPAPAEQAAADVPRTKVLVASEGLPRLPHNADGRGFPHFYPETYLLRRGDVGQKVRAVAPGYPRVLHRGGSSATDLEIVLPVDPRPDASYRRAALARWLTDVEQGPGALVARVAVNRLWQRHFGRGIVATPNDFGTAGARPTHPELLEWLAAELVAGGWKLKPIHQAICTSDAYLQGDKSPDDQRSLVDADNALFWHRPPRRLEAEAIRDAMLAASGQLDRTMYGPGTLDQDMRRRSVYFFIKRSDLIPMMMLFDWPEHLVSLGQRQSTTIAPQALMFLNSPQGREYAEAFAARLAVAGDEGARIRLAYESALSRPPSQAEARVAVDFLADAQALRGASPDGAATLPAWADFCQMLFGLNEFIYVD